MFAYELGTTEEKSERWHFLEDTVSWRCGDFDGSELLLYRDDYECVAEAWRSGGTYEMVCTSSADLVTALDAVRAATNALGHHLCVALKTREPVSFEKEIDESIELVNQRSPSSAPQEA